MSMSRKDFVLLAEAIKDLRERDIEDDSVVDTVAHSHCDQRALRDV